MCGLRLPEDGRSDKREEERPNRRKSRLQKACCEVGSEATLEHGCEYDDASCKPQFLCCIVIPLWFLSSDGEVIFQTWNLGNKISCFRQRERSRKKRKIPEEEEILWKEMSGCEEREGRRENNHFFFLFAFLYLIH